jgi:cytochrome c oxidase assembly protein subunit 11
MKPGETREMTVVFYVDPSLAKDSDQTRLDTITLSYTFYRVPNPEKPVAEAPAAAGSTKL